MGRYIIITKFVIFGTLLLSLNSLFLGRFVILEASFVIGRLVILRSQDFLFLVGSLFREVRYTGRFAVRYREARYYYNEIRFSIGSLPGSLHQEVGFTGRFHVISKGSLVLYLRGSLIQEAL